MNDRQRFIAKCVTVVCVAAIAGALYLVVDFRERADADKAAERLEAQQKQENEAMQSAVKQFDSDKADRTLAGIFMQKLGGYYHYREGLNDTIRFPDGFPAYTYSKSTGTFAADYYVDIKYADTGWQHCTYSVEFYPGGALAQFYLAKSEPLPTAPIATTH